MRRLLLLLLAACSPTSQAGIAPPAQGPTDSPRSTAASVPVEKVPPRPEDVSSIDGIMRAFYEVIDLPAGAPRQWARDRTLYSPWIHFVASGKKIQIWDHQQFVDHSDPNMRDGIHEREIFRTVRRYGNIAHVDSTYEMQSGKGATLSRGVNSVELYFDGARWWIASNIWQSEDPEHPIPSELLPPPTP